jgi:hypothetical protein
LFSRKVNKGTYYCINHKECELNLQNLQNILTFFNNMINYKEKIRDCMICNFDILNEKLSLLLLFSKIQNEQSTTYKMSQYMNTIMNSVGHHHQSSPSKKIALIVL